MILGAEIGLLIYGIIALVKLKFSMGKLGYVTGWRAVVLSLICIALLPCILIVGVAIGIFAAIQGIELNTFSLVWIDVVGLAIAITATTVLGRIFLAQQATEAKDALANYPTSQPVAYDPNNPYAPTQTRNF